MRNVIVILFATMLFACSKGTPEEQAMKAAVDCYEALLDGDYVTFLEGRAGMDSIPDSFREQLLVSYKQFMHLQQEAHQGIKSIEPMRALPDSSLNLIQVFLLVSYADSTHEEIVVPMVEHDGEWKMK